MIGIFGYGSLISPDSRSRTAGSGMSVPLTVDGFERRFSILNEAAGMASGAVFLNSESVCNGILFGVDDDQLSAFDARELPWGYARTALSVDETTFARADNWVYLLDTYRAPTRAAPIVQSYVDVIIDGCLQVSEAFATQFVEQTHNWDCDWYNDRHMPRYARPLAASQARLQQIDQVLAEVLGAARLEARDAFQPD
ncbi:MAG: gamma-glutamylcyclotransferase [Gammaproteobacteria bacterium]|nr:gamma-glutamylcyclotransferase [Gammaproteobacteria bacterium]